MGSMGNGAAMRVAPIGAYFADDLDKVLSHARASAEVTHGHREGIAGAMATAVASALLLNKSWGIISEKGRLFYGISQINCRKAIPNIKYPSLLRFRRKAA